MEVLASPIQLIGTICFILAILHTFAANKFIQIAHRYPEGSMHEISFHFLGEVEVVFGIWSGIFIVFISFLHGFMPNTHSDLNLGLSTSYIFKTAVEYLEGLNFTEPLFVFVIMCVAGTRPLIILAERIILFFSRILPFKSKVSFYISTLILGPIFGSFITEPAAMTVTALILLDYFYSSAMSKRFMYATIGLLFVNVSIGGTLSHFAAPPVLMVAGKWGWGFAHMFFNFGYKATLAVSVSTLVIAFFFRRELEGNLVIKQKHDAYMVPKFWIILVHLIFLVFVVYTAHHPVIFMGAFLFFLGFVTVTKEYQDEVKLRESLLVGFFLAGLVILGSVQDWWLKPLLSQLGDLALYLGASGLTAITDNAALTYLGSLVDLSDSAKYNLVAGAVTGGGLTVIANAPNPAGYGILKNSFGKDGVSPLWLFMFALFPTIVAALAFQILP